MTPRYRLVIFDFDGTLADSGDWFLSIADHLADRFKFRRVAADDVEMLRGRTSSEVIRHLGIPRWKLPAIGRYVHALLAQQADRIALFDGIVPVLQHLAANGVRIALVTSNAEDNARAILGPTNAAMFERFECGASLFGKARRYRRVLRKTGIAASQVISIGDETRDVVAAKKVGVTSAAVLWGYANRAALTQLQPDFLFERPDQVLDVVLGAPD
ncbi:HAD hydrolase-like protein [Sphingomonas sp. HMP6]|uniref:HAD hydrolase-like protein n=1 Tax=Sphingomonas sp. HMP6 TaxID=1517551 RepID=UPI001596B113|nr:HAD hydrolase-like protein [Sphingomonas sp. HMP6]BCA58998.1 haloacid dehalogenase [Sphingomonas sp. HMP6]